MFTETELLTEAATLGRAHLGMLRDTGLGRG